MTPQQEKQLRLQARARGYDKAKEDAFVEFARQKSVAQAPQQAPEPEPQGDGFFKSVAKGIVNPFLRLGATANALGTSKALGGKGANLQPVNVPVFGETKPIASKKDALGVGAELASLAVGGGGTGQIIKQGLKQAVVRGAVQGARAGVVSGGLYSGGQALQQNKSTLDTLKDTATGATLGGVTGGVLGATTPLVSKGFSSLKNTIKSPLSSNARDKVVKQVESKYDELFTGTKSAKKSYTRSTAQGKTPSRFLAEHGLIVDIKDGKINSQAVIEKISKQAEPLEDVLDDILRAKDTTLPTSSRISLDKLADSAKKRISTESNIAGGYIEQQYADIDKLISSLKKAYGDTVGLSTLNKIKRGQWQQSKVFDMTRPNYAKDSHYALGKEAKEMIENAVAETDIKKLNQYLGDHFDAINNLQKIDGNAIKGGRLGNYFGRTIGAVVGAKGGPLGSLAGAAGGDYVSKVMQNNYIANPIKRMLLKKVTPDNPAFKAAQKALLDIEMDKSSRLLPAASGKAFKKSQTVTATPDVINLPSKTPPSVDTPFKGNGALSRGSLYAAAPIAGIEKDDQGNFKFNPEKAAAAVALTAGGSKLLRKYPNIDKATQKEMVAAIDYIRLKKPFNQRMEDDIGYLVEFLTNRYGVKEPKTMAQVANMFEKYLNKGQTKGAMSIFK